MSKTGLTTAEIAEIFGCKENTPRSNLCLHGHFLGVKPVKLPNGRLLWPAEQVERVLSGLPARSEAEALQPNSPSWRTRIKQAGATGQGGAA